MKNNYIRYWPEIHEQSETPILLSSSTSPVYAVRLFWAVLFFTVWLQLLFFGLLKDLRTLSVTRHMRKPDNFVVQTFSYTLQKIARTKIFIVLFNGHKNQYLVGQASKNYTNYLFHKNDLNSMRPKRRHTRLNITARSKKL